MYTTKAFRIALTAAALTGAASLTGSAADAKPRRVVVTDFDGPRALADSSRTAVLNLVDDEYDIVSTKRWEKVRAAFKDTRGPEGWRKSSRKSGVDVVIDGWIQDEGRIKLLYVVVVDASNGAELDRISVKLGKSGPTSTNMEQIRVRFDEVLAYIHAVEEVTQKLPNISTNEPIGSGKPSRREPVVEERTEDTGRRGSIKDDTAVRFNGASQADTEDDVDDDVTERKPVKVKVAATEPIQNIQGAEDKTKIQSIFPASELPDSDKKELAEPWRTPRFALEIGGYYGSRSFVAEGDSDNIDDYSARSKGLQLHGAVYPFPSRKTNGQLQGIGFTFGLYKSAGSDMIATTEDQLGTYAINQNGFEGAVHYRQPLGIVSIDGEAGYSQHNYEMPSDFTLDIPDAQYSAFHAGAHLDLHVTDHAEVGFGAKLLYVLGNGDISDEGWFGPGNSSGFNLDASFKIPLPKQLFVRGELAYRRITNSFHGLGGIITEEEAVDHAADATMNGSVNLGISF